MPASTDPDTVQDRKSTRLNSSHLVISYAVFCLKKKKSVGLFRGEVQARHHQVDFIGLAGIKTYRAKFVADRLSADFVTVDYRELLSFFFIATATTEIYTLSLHDALPI